MLIKHNVLIKQIIGIIAVGVIIWIVLKNKDALAYLTNLKASNLILLVVLYMLQFIAAAIPIWIIIIKLGGRRLSLFKWIKISVVGRMANYMVPKSGAVYKAHVLKSDYELSYYDFINSYAFFSWLTICLNIAVATLLIFLFLPDLQFGNFLALPVLGLLLLILVVAPFVARHTLKLFSVRNIYINMLLQKTMGVFKTMLVYGKDFRLMVELVGLTFIKICLNILFFFFLFTKIGIEIGFGQIALFIAVQQISVLVFITPGNIGIRELLYGAVGGVVGIGVTEGIMASAILRAINYVVVFPLGLLFSGDRFFSGKRIHGKTKTDK